MEENFPDKFCFWFYTFKDSPSCSSTMKTFEREERLREKKRIEPFVAVLPYRSIWLPPCEFNNFERGEKSQLSEKIRKTMKHRQSKTDGANKAYLKLISKLLGEVEGGVEFHNAPRCIFITCNQCCGSGSESGSTWFWASWIRVLQSPSKNSKKYLHSYCFVTSFWLIFFEKCCKCIFKM